MSLPVRSIKLWLHDRPLQARLLALIAEKSPPLALRSIVESPARLVVLWQAFEKDVRDHRTYSESLTEIFHRRFGSLDARTYFKAPKDLYGKFTGLMQTIRLEDWKGTCL